MSRRFRCALSVLICLFPLSMAMAGEAADKPRSLRVAVVQMGLEPTLAANRDKIVRLIQEAAADARLVIFPEGALASPPGTPLTEYRLAVEAVAKAARESGIYVVAPSRFVPQGRSKHHNQLYVFSPQGETLLVYDKVWHAREYDAPKMVSVDGVLCSFLICADRWSRPVADLPPVMGAQVLIECSGNLSMSPAEALLHDQIVANLASYRTLTVVANPLYPDLVTHRGRLEPLRGRVRRLRLRRPDGRSAGGLGAVLHR